MDRENTQDTYYFLDEESANYGLKAKLGPPSAFDHLSSTYGYFCATTELAETLWPVKPKYLLPGVFKETVCQLLQFANSCSRGVNWVQVEPKYGQLFTELPYSI